MRRVRIAAASLTAAGLLGAVAIPALAMPPTGDPSNPTFPPAQHLCNVQGGEFAFFGPGAFYECTKSSEFSRGQVNGARGLCEGGYRGLFVDFAPGVYRCFPTAGDQADKPAAG